VTADALRLGIAPRFHLSADWGARLEVNDGIEVDAAGALWPKASWRRAGEEESHLWLGEGGGLLFQLPSHLRRSWWRAAEQIEPGSSGGGAYQEFVAHAVDFLTFKQLPLPEACGFDVRVSRPGLRTTRTDAPGLGFTAPAAGRRTLAWVNLGDEATHLVLVPAPAVHDPAALRRLAAEAPDSPLLRLRLEPGEGLWFPAAPIAHDGDTVGKLEVDVVLVLTAAEEWAAAAR